MKPASSSSRIPCLDGLRAVSISAVLLAHLQGTQGFPSAGFLQTLGDLGNLGVRVFFVISGFLITHLLLQEFRSTGSISLKAFYIRRTFRIFPAFYTFIAAVAVLGMVGVLVVKPADLLYAATYTINFVHRKSWVVGHAWSLAVEEQFYLLWPACVVLLGWRRSTFLAVAVLVISPLLRIGVWYLLPEFRGIITKAFPTICDAIATGCVLACLRDRLSASPRYLAFLQSPAFLVVPLLILASNAFASHTRPDLLIGHSIRNIGIALCIDWCLRNAHSAVGRFLNLRPMVWVGTLSYSLYLWQQIFLNRNSDAFYCAFPLNVILAFTLAALSYYLVERPFLRARVRLFPDAAHPRPTPAAMPFAPAPNGTALTEGA